MSGNGGDRPRYLHRDASRNYADSPYLAARHEPEALTEDEQREITARAHRRWEQEQQRAWGQAHRTIDSALATFIENGHPNREVLHDLRAVNRHLGRVDRQLGLQ